MSKALSVVVLLNVLVSAGVVALGILAYLDRTVLKLQVLELESTAATMAQNLQWGAEVAWETPEEKKPLPFLLPRPASAEELPGLDDRLGTLVRFSTQRQAQLSLRHDELVSAENSLREVRSTIEVREREVSAAENQKAQLERNLRQLRTEVQAAEGEVASASRDRQRLEQSISDKNTEITDLNNDLASLEIDLETRIQERDLAQAEYDRCRIGASGNQEGMSNEIKGKAGTVMAVNPVWEYVVIDKGMINNVEVNVEAFVHRSGEYVGKLQVVRVEDTVAVAEILPGSVVVENGIQPGDKLFF